MVVPSIEVTRRGLSGLPVIEIPFIAIHNFVLLTKVYASCLKSGSSSLPQEIDDEDLDMDVDGDIEPEHAALPAEETKD